MKLCSSRSAPYV